MARKTIGTERLEIYGYDKLGNNITTQNLYDSRGNVRFEMDGNTVDKQKEIPHIMNMMNWED